MSRWFRLYDEMLDDPKVQMLSPELFKAWVNLLALASRNHGLLPAIDRIAFALRASPSDTQSRLDDLILAGLIDIRSDGKLEPHNWPSRQWKSDDSKERVRKHREAKRQACNGDVTVTVTPPETDTEPDSETEYKSLPLEQDAARENQEVKALIPDFKVGRRKGEVKAEMIATAEGLGLPVDQMLAATARDAKRSPTGYFRALCAGELARRIPKASGTFIDAVLEGDPEALRTAYPILMGET